MPEQPKLKVGDVVRWRNSQLYPYELLVVVEVGPQYADPEQQARVEALQDHDRRSYVAVRALDSREVLWYHLRVERFEPRWFKPDPYLTAVYKRRQHAENPDPTHPD